MITLDQYFIGRSHSAEQESSAVNMLSLVNALLARYATETGVEVQEHAHTNSMIAPAGSQGFDSVSGKTEGGFRLPDCPQGAPNSSHKQAKAVDVYDPDNAIDDWITDDILASAGLYREHPDSTPTWCHLTTRAPGSGHRTFYP